MAKKTSNTGNTELDTVLSLSDEDFAPAATSGNYYDLAAHDASNPLIGIYKGFDKVGRDTVHSVETRDGIVQLKGTRELSFGLKRGTPGRGVKIVYNGKKRTDAGQTIESIDVLWARN